MLAEGRADGMGVVSATAYQDEAGRCGRVLLLHQGALLADAPPADFLAPLRGRVFRMDSHAATRRAAAGRAAADPAVLDALVEGSAVRIVLRRGATPPDPVALGATCLTPTKPRFEDGFVDAISVNAPIVAAPLPMPVVVRAVSTKPAIEARDLVRRFGSFTAVDHVGFDVAPGEIFGLLGPNGAGKSTTFRMLCGLLRPSSGSAFVAGQDLLRAPAQARSRLGYTAERFSLYAELSVTDKLRFSASIYGLTGSRRRMAVGQALERYELQDVASSISGELPLGVKQRLARRPR